MKHGMILGLAVVLAICGCYQPDSGVRVGKDLSGLNPTLAGLYPANDCSGDFMESNDTRDGAAWLNSGDSYDLELCGNDDWFYLKVDQGDVVNVNLTFEHKDGDLDVELLGESSSNRIMANSTDDNETATLEVEAGGRLYVRVFGYAGAENRYSLSVSIEESTMQSSCPVDLLEPNDSREQARELRPDSYQELTVCRNHPDHYSVYLNRGDTVQVTMYNFSETVNTRLSVYGPDNGVGYVAEFKDREETLNLVAKEAGLATIEVSNDHWAWSRDVVVYDLTVQVFKPNHEECLDDPLEPNDDHEQSHTMIKDTWASLTSCPANLDVFHEVVDPGERIRVYLQHDAGDADLSLSIEHPDGAVTTGGRVSGYQSMINSQAGVCGSSYLKVENHTEQNIPYWLKVKVDNPDWGPERLEAMCGDARSGFGCGATTWAGPTVSGVGSRSYRILLKECSSCPVGLRISARLLVPEGVGYKVDLENEGGGWLMVDRKTEGQFKYLTWKTGGQNTELRLNVIYEGFHESQACLDDWMLEIRGGGTADNFSGFLP